MRDWQSRLTGLAIAACAISVTLGVITLIDQGPPAAPLASPGVLDKPVVLIPVANTVRELCTDDTLAVSPFIEVPLLTIDAATIRLNGKSVSQKTLVAWARTYYHRKAEKALWVQINGPDHMMAFRTLRPLEEIFPDLEFREIDPRFVGCPQTIANPTPALPHL